MHSRVINVVHSKSQLMKLLAVEGSKFHVMLLVHKSGSCPSSKWGRDMYVRS
jgi:hypothetical protein